MRWRLFPVAAAFATGALLTMWLSGERTRGGSSAIAASRAADAPKKAAEPAVLAADVDVLKAKAVDQAHVMASVAYHFNNMWFAAHHKNWPLAQFYWNETRSHLRWAVRVIPVRKDAEGKEFKLEPLLEAVENGSLKQLQETISAQEQEKFVAAYRYTLETCYSCHKTADKPYLRPQIPERPAEPTINFDPQAKWPL